MDRSRPPVTWVHLEARDGRTWHDGDRDRLQAWVATVGARPGARPFRSDHPYGYPIPADFRHR